MWVRLLVIGATCAGCDVALSEISQIYSRPGDGPITCGINLDNKNLISVDSIGTGLDRASVDETIIHLYSHKPAGTVDESTVEEVVAAASDRGLPFVTYADLVDGTAEYGLAYSFDDRDIVGWHGLLPMFRYYDARVTFFISEFETIDPDTMVLLHEIAADGHAIEFHGALHRNAESTTAELGAQGWIDLDIVPGLDLMRAEGFNPRVYAYPYGARTAETDRAILEVLPLVRASHFSCPR